MTYTPFGICVESVDRLNKENIDAKVRFDYPLTPDSIVLEIGGFKGNWTEDLINYHGFSSHIYAFEPVPEFFDEAIVRLQGKEKVHFFKYGLSDEDCIVPFNVDTDRTGLYSKNGPTTMVELRDVAKVLEDLNFKDIDLCAVNCEGGEYKIVPRLIETGFINRIKFLLVQFHAVVPECEVKREKINTFLNLTHEQIYNYPFAWDMWKRR